MQIFGELEEVGKTLQDDVLDAAPAHGEMQGDISQCPYYAAKMGKLEQTIHLNSSLINQGFPNFFFFVSETHKIFTLITP